MEKLKVAHVHTTDRAGGGAKMVHQLHSCLNEHESFKSRLFVGNKRTSGDEVVEISKYIGEGALNELIE